MEKKNGVKKFNLAIPEFLKTRMFYLIAGAILLIAVAGGIYSIYLLGNGLADAEPEHAKTASELSAENPEVSDVAEVLPQQRRESSDQSDSAAWNAFEPLVDPFSDPMRLTGIVSGGRGGDMAIIESSGIAYLVAVGDYVDDLWAVRQISGDMVIMRAYNQEVSLFLDQPPVTRMLDQMWEDEGEEELEEGA